MSEISVKPHLATATLPPAQMFVGGAWVEGPVKPIRHLHPATGENVFDLPAADTSTVDAAVSAARKAFDEGPWPRLPGRDRARYLRRIAELIRADVNNLDALLSLDNATPASFVGFYQMGAEYPADLFDTYAGWVDKVTGETFPQWEPTQPFVFTTHEPVGVVGVITPWNAPMSLLVQKLAPALAAGCTIAAKPSELAPLTSLRIAELIAAADLPPAVFNVVTGPGEPVGTSLVADPRVDKVIFGPVLCVIPFDEEAEAIRMANETPYGLAAAVYTSDVSRALRVGSALRVGNVGVNSWTLQPHAPFGGMKQSGLGRENGRAGILEYLDTKTTFLG